jgi:hypothetical protein
MAFMNTSRASSRKLITSESLIALVAASCALATTNSVTDVPRNSAARSMSRFWVGVILASNRSSFRKRCACAMTTSAFDSRSVRLLAVHVKRETASHHLSFIKERIVLYLPSYQAVLGPDRSRRQPGPALRLSPQTFLRQLGSTAASQDSATLETELLCPERCPKASKSVGCEKGFFRGSCRRRSVGEAWFLHRPDIY